MGRGLVVWVAAGLFGCRADCTCETIRHLEQGVLVSQCEGAEAARACVEAAGRGGTDRAGARVPPDSLSAAAAICVAASNGMTPGLSQYHAIWDPNSNGDRLWSVQMIRQERCLTPHHADGRADNWHIDAVTGLVRSYGAESYSANNCLYGQ